MAEAVADQLQQTTLDGSINHTASERASLSQQEAGAEPTGVAPESEAHEVTVRALVSSKAAGIIIGRAGQAVAEVRSQTGVKAGVSKTVPGVVDRILSITGTPDAISEALRMISTTLADSLANDLQAPPTPASINFLIPHAAMGALIGKSGARIKEIQDGSGSRMVAHKDMLPQSTERIVEISGTPEGIAIAAKSVAETLQAEADKLHGSVLFHPQAIGPEGPAQIGQPMSFGGNLSVLGGYQSSAGRGGRGGRRGVSSSGFGSRAMPGGHARLSSSSFGASQTAAPFAVQSAAMPAPLFNPDDPTLRTQHISFPADMIGCIIGKGGSRISEIRRASGSRISIAREPNASGERLFSIVGTAESNEKALYLLYSSLEAEKERRSQHEQEAEQNEMSGMAAQTAA